MRRAKRSLDRPGARRGLAAGIALGCGTQLASFGPTDPALYGISHEPLTPSGRDGLVAIGISTLMGFDFPVMYTDSWQHAPSRRLPAVAIAVPSGAGYSIPLFRD